jgi:hypothetical protein
MKTKRMEIREEMMASSTLYCCYCLEPKRSKISCCKEVHFLHFRDLYDSQQYELIQDQIDDDEWSGR